MCVSVCDLWLQGPVRRGGNACYALHMHEQPNITIRERVGLTVSRESESCLGLREKKALCFFGFD